MLLERTFIDEQVLPLHSYEKHVILAPSSLNVYAGSAFAGIYDLMWAYKDAKNKNDSEAAAKVIVQVRQHLSVIVYHIDAAAAFVSQKWY